MKNIYFIIVSIIILFCDIALQKFVPGFSWLTPTWLIAYLLISKNLYRDSSNLIVIALIYDFISGLPLGIFTISYIFLIALVSFITRWISIKKNYSALVIPVFIFSNLLVILIFSGYAIRSL